MKIRVELVQKFDVDKFVRNNVFNPTVAALNAVSRDIVKDVKEEIAHDFDRPTPFTRRGVAVAQPATADQTEPNVVIVILPQQAKYLGLEVLGGDRQSGDYATIHNSKHKNLRGSQSAWAEILALGAQANGGDKMLPTDGIVMPGPDAPLDEYGNLPRGYLTRMSAKTFRIRGKKNNTLVLLRDGSGTKLVAEINPHAHYKPLLKFFQAVGTSFAVRMPKAWEKVVKRQFKIPSSRR